MLKINANLEEKQKLIFVNTQFLIIKFYKIIFNLLLTPAKRVFFLN